MWSRAYANTQVRSATGSDPGPWTQARAGGSSDSRPPTGSTDRGGATFRLGALLALAASAGFALVGVAVHLLAILVVTIGLLICVTGCCTPYPGADWSG